MSPDDDMEPDEPIAELRAFEFETDVDFHGAVRRSIERRTTAGEIIRLSTAAFAEVAFEFLKLIQPVRPPQEGPVPEEE